MSVAYRMLMEGHDVTVGIIEDDRDTLTKEELKTHKPEKPDDRNLRMSMFDGMLKKVSAKKLLSVLLAEKKKEDWFVMCDLNTCFKYGEALRGKGFAGNFPSEKDRFYEVNRAKANELVRENYPGVHVGEYQEFQKIEEGQEYLASQKIPFVLKSMGDSGDTIVGPDDPEACRDLLTDQLSKQHKEYEQMGFILEEKITDFVELTPEMMFWDGKPLMATLDIENKPLGSGNIGLSMGCMQNLIVQTKIDDPINRLAFPEYVDEMASNIKGLSIFDISFLIGKDGRFNFGEFCFNRFGWDAFPTELAMAGGASEFFEAVREGSYPLRYRYGAGIRMVNMDKKGRAPEGKIVEYLGKSPDQVYYFDIMMKGGQMRTAGAQWDQAVIVGAADTAKKAVESAYEVCGDYHFVDKFYRPSEDFLSEDYGTAIMNRLKFATSQKLI